MAYLDLNATESAPLQRASHDVRLGEAERRVMLTARRDAAERRPGLTLRDSRLEALRRYAMLDQRSRSSAANRLMAAGYSATERRVIDAMLASLPAKARSRVHTSNRITCGLLILAPLLMAIGAYRWADLYVEDSLIGIVLAGLAALLLMPFISAALAPRR